jgi:hypothetical protein
MKAISDVLLAFLLVASLATGTAHLLRQQHRCPVLRKPCHTLRIPPARIFSPPNRLVPWTWGLLASI